MKYVLVRAIYWFAEILSFLMILRCIFSWIRPNPYGTLGKIDQFCIRMTEPVVAPCRQLLSRFNTGMFDFSVFLAFFLVEIVAKVLVQLIVVIL